MSFIVIQFLNGMTISSSLFLLSCGLSIIFGVTRVINFAHGSLYMLGGYIAYTLVTRFTSGPFEYLLAMLLSAFAVGLIGAIIEILILRRIYRASELFPLLATFGVVLVVEDIALSLWGPMDLLGPQVPGFKGAIDLFGHAFPVYDVCIIALGPIVLGGLWVLFHRTRWGTLVRAATEDREMIGALGVHQSLLFTGVFVLGAFLAGLGGAIQLPRQALSLHMDLTAITDAFVVVVIGGMGSIAGAFLASILIGQLHAFGIVFFPEITLVLVFAIMGVVLVLRPTGLLGRPEVSQTSTSLSGAPPLRRATGRVRVLAYIAVAGLLLLPPFFSNYSLVILTEIVVLALFAASLHFIMGTGGLVSFGHAAYFGLGAYAVAFMISSLSAPMGMALVAAPLLAGLGALFFGWFVVRLSGVYLAMLTLAFAQITWSIVFQSDTITGGDNGIIGVWPAKWAASTLVFYYLALTICGASVLLLHRIIFSPFGYALRAGRDSWLRSEAIGLNVRRHQWFAFALTGFFAGIAGGVYALLKGSVFPTFMDISVSTDALLMVLLGGINTLVGPLVGAAMFTELRELISTTTNYWRGIVGFIVIALVLLFPEGIVGFLRRFVTNLTPADKRPWRS